MIYTFRNMIDFILIKYKINILNIDFFLNLDKKNDPFAGNYSSKPDKRNQNNPKIHHKTNETRLMTHIPIIILCI